MSKGGAREGAGRPKGIPNKATTQAREAIADFVEGNVGRLNGWLDAIAEKDPEKAFNAFMSVIEYHIPKLQRTESRFVDENGKDRTIEIVERVVMPDAAVIDRKKEAKKPAID